MWACTNDFTTSESYNLDHTDDDSYIEDESHRRDYLLSDVGVIWRGTSHHKVPLTWEFGQVCMLVQLYQVWCKH